MGVDGAGSFLFEPSDHVLPEGDKAASCRAAQDSGWSRRPFEEQKTRSGYEGYARATTVVSRIASERKCARMLPLVAPSARRRPISVSDGGPVTCMSTTPHIVVQGAERAAAFYRDALSAEEIRRTPTPDGRLMSLQLRIGDAYVHLADEFPEMGVLAPPSIGGTSVVLALEVDDAEAVFAQAVAAGAEVRQPLAEVFWGDLHGQFDDPFGHRWNISQHSSRSASLPGCGRGGVARSHPLPPPRSHHRRRSRTLAHTSALMSILRFLLVRAHDEPLDRDADGIRADRLVEIEVMVATW